MNIADAARFIADGMVMKIELSESVDKKVDEIREEVESDLLKGEDSDADDSTTTDLDDDDEYI